MLRSNTNRSRGRRLSRSQSPRTGRAERELLYVLELSRIEFETMNLRNNHGYNADNDGVQQNPRNNNVQLIGVNNGQANAGGTNQQIIMGGAGHTYVRENDHNDRRRSYSHSPDPPAAGARAPAAGGVVPPVVAPAAAAPAAAPVAAAGGGAPVAAAGGGAPPPPVAGPAPPGPPAPPVVVPQVRDNYVPARRFTDPANPPQGADRAFFGDAVFAGRNPQFGANRNVRLGGLAFVNLNVRGHRAVGRIDLGWGQVYRTTDASAWLQFEAGGPQLRYMNSHITHTAP